MRKKKNREMTLKDKQRYFPILVEHSSDLILLTSSDGRVVYANTRALETTMYGLDELVDLPLERLLPSGILPHCSDMEPVPPQGQGTTSGYVSPLVRKDGVALTLGVKVVPTEWNGKPANMVILSHHGPGPTAEASLNETESRYRSFFERTGIPMMIIEEDTTLFLINTECEKIFGCSRSELEGRQKWTEFVVPEDLDGFRAALQSQRNNPYDTPVKHAFHLQDRTGRQREILATLSRIPGTNKSITILLDITDFENMEREALEPEKNYRALMEEVRRTLKVEALGTLTGGIAHDFNNILGAITSYTEMALLKVPKGPPVQHYLDQVLSACRRAGDLVKQILTFSRQTEPERRSILVDQIVREALNLLRSSLPEHIEILDDLDGVTGPILADPTQMHQVIMNLCLNAVHAMREKGGVMEVSLEEVHLDLDAVAPYPRLGPGPYVRLTVRDTGHGMDDAVLQRIFEPFFTTKDSEEGTGMGLPVVHGIVRNHGGEIGVSSKPGIGTEFHVYLPKLPEALIQETLDLFTASHSPQG